MVQVTGNMKSVTFIRNHSPYNAGDVAGFPSGKADDFIKSKVAVPFQASNYDEDEDVTVTKDMDTDTKNTDDDKDTDDKKKNKRNKGKTRNRMIETK